ncbi:helix-turn-helix domain-containing protein [Sphingobium estronivorans]|uniref:helix-turn-helix domain-containing protein n=1 Tax=Sphingobium estronivorans TaxID=1577690 RepID=UPI00123A260F|nr:helix-turn-helix domain-containing protein [Sphingobium estronivorans]
MSDDKFLTPEEVSKRYRDTVTVGTLENWRALGIGPSYIKVGKAVLYPIEELEAWDRNNMVVCRKSKVVGRARTTDG